MRICPTGLGLTTNQAFTNSISQNYPNPTNGKTQIDYTVSESSSVSIEVFDVTGRKIKALVSTNVDAGKHTVEFNDLDKYADGSYFYKIELKQNNKVVYSETKRMTIAK